MILIRKNIAKFHQITESEGIHISLDGEAKGCKDNSPYA
jgi:hypothetical protein